ncbi:hypothetical protein COTS27_01319 [Spirochaetota bacterium]|nr:hypothetical protein COTS27_01319 [Spirochaetota bacterium]
MNWNKKKNLIHNTTTWILVIIIIFCALIVIVSVYDPHKLTAVATAILALAAIVTFFYAKRQLDLMTDHNKTMAKYNGTKYTEKILELRDSLSDSCLEAENARRELKKYCKDNKYFNNEGQIIPQKLESDTKGKKLYDEEGKLSHTFYIKLNNLCMYLLSLAEGRDKKELSINDLDIKHSFSKDFKTIWEVEKPTMDTEDFSNDFSMIHKLFDAWDIKNK